MAYTVFVKGLAQSGCLDEAMELIETLCAEGSTVAPNVRTFSTLLRNCVRHADGVNADRCFEACAARGSHRTPRRSSTSSRRSARRSTRGAWAAHAEMEREYLDATPQALAALAAVSSITGDVASAEKACVMAKAAIEANGAGVVAPSGDGAREDSLFSSRMDDDEDRAENDDAPGPGVPPDGAYFFVQEPKPFRRRNHERERPRVPAAAHQRRRQAGGGRRGVPGARRCVRGGGGGGRARGHASASSPVKVVEGEGPVLDFRKLFGGGAGSIRRAGPRAP